MGKWERIKLSEVLKEKTERNKNNETDLVLSVTNSQGFVKQSDFFEGTVHSENISNYKLVRKNEFAYNPSRINVGSIDILKDYDIGALSPMYVIFSVDETRLLPDYFKYYFQTHKFNENVKNNTQGSVRNSLSFKALSEFEYLLPPLEEQKRIVKILDQVNKVIEKYHNLINEKEQFIKSQFVEMFGDPLTSNNYGRVTLDKIIKVNQGLQIPISKRFDEYRENRYKYITIQFLNGGKEIEYIENPKKSVMCTKDDVLMTRTGNTGRVITNVEGVFHNNFFKMDFDRKKINRDFLVKYFENDKVHNEILKRATTQTISDLSHSEFYKMSIDIPPLSLQITFAKIVQLIDKQKFELEKQKQNYIDLKKGLMQQLLTGKLKA